MYLFIYLKKKSGNYSSSKARAFSLAEPPRGRADGRMILSCERSSEPNQSWMYFLEKQPQSKNFHSTKHQERQKKTKNLKQLQQQIHLQVELGFEVSPHCCRDVDRQMCKGSIAEHIKKKGVSQRDRQSMCKHRHGRDVPHPSETSACSTTREDL